MLHRTQIILQYLGRSLPSQRAHGEMVIIPAVVCLKLFCKVLKRIKTVGGIKTLVVLPVAALHFAVMPWGVGTDKLVPDAVAPEPFLKKGGFVPVGGKAVRKLRSVVGLDAFNGAGEGFDQMVYEQGGGIGIMFLKSFHKTPSGELINGGILEKLFSDYPAVFQAGGRDEFHIHLNPLTRVVHLLIWFGDVLGIRRMYSHNALFFKESVKSGNGAFITAQAELDPENNEAGIGIASAHIPNQFDFLRRMLIGMRMGAS